MTTISIYEDNDRLRELLEMLVEGEDDYCVKGSYRNCENILSLKITDDGIGFDATKSFSGNGLKNMQKRAENLGGNLKIISEIGKGTALKILVPIRD